jgi:hypothetical protein
MNIRRQPPAPGHARRSRGRERNADYAWADVRIAPVGVCAQMFQFCMVAREDFVVVKGLVRIPLC